MKGLSLLLLSVLFGSDLASAGVHILDNTPRPRSTNEGLLSTRAMSTSCGQTVTVKQGEEYIITSPGYDGVNKYPMENCVTHFLVPADTFLTMDCDEFKTNSRYVKPNVCFGDGLYIRKDGVVTWLCDDILDDDNARVDIDDEDEDYKLTMVFVVRSEERDVGYKCTIEAISTEEGLPQEITTLAPPVNPTPTDTPCPCGRLGSDLDRIVGGSESKANRWAWQVGLVPNGSWKPFCGGTIITDRYVLTAAHCTKGNDVSAFTIVVGDWDHTSVNGKEKRHAIKRKVEHPNYNSVTQNLDFSLLEVKTAFTFNKQIGPACLPPFGSSDNYANDLAFATGWGTTSSGGSQPDKLRQVSLQVRANNDCGNYNSGSITENMICAAGRDRTYGRDSCQGDSGGPLVTPIDGRFYLIGVTSWGAGCGATKFPGVYARVSRVLPWIKATTSNSGVCKL